MIKKVIKKIPVILAVIFILSAGALYLIESMYFRVQVDDDFSKVEFKESSYFLYDLGVADVNSDGILDIFTSNHFALQRVMFGDGSGRFSNSLADLHLYQDTNFPAIEDMQSVVMPDKEGVHIFWHKNTLNIRNNNTLIENIIEGELLFNADIKEIGGNDRDIDVLTLDIHSEKTQSGAPKSIIKFRLEKGESLQIKPELIAIPITISIERSYDLSRLFLGSEQVVPKKHEFTIFLRDRHGMAWADFTGDGLMDLFIARGGLKGRMLQQPLQDDFVDELLVNIGDSFKSITLNSGLVKNGCSGHQTAWVDFNNDSKLDLYITCRRAGQANQLYKNTGDYNFEDVAKQTNLDLQGKWLGPFLWLDFDNDNDQDLILEEGNKFWLYVNEQGVFTRQYISSNKGGISKLTTADYDLDGDQDIYAASSVESVLLINRGDSFITGNLGDLGLPLKAETANWLDFDNDGLMDLHVVPGGIFQQQSNHKFMRTGVLEHTFHLSVEDARSAWFDMDNDGDRDLIMAVKYKPSPGESLLNRLARNVSYKRDWSIFLYNNLHEENHWLQLQLIGPKGNRQAIGARVVLENEDGAVIQQVVGSAEGSHSSQGHYRLYFGLGRYDKPRSLRVVWPDGQLQTIDLAVDKLIIVEYEQ